MENSRTYYGEALVNLEELVETNKKRFIKLEYYGTKQVTQDKFNEYGIEVIKKEYINNQFVEEIRNVNRITESKRELEEIISILKRNKVTPIGLVDIVKDLIGRRIAD